MDAHFGVYILGKLIGSKRVNKLCLCLFDGFAKFLRVDILLGQDSLLLEASLPLGLQSFLFLYLGLPLGLDLLDLPFVLCVLPILLGDHCLPLRIQLRLDVRMVEATSASTVSH